MKWFVGCAPMKCCPDNLNFGTETFARCPTCQRAWERIQLGDDIGYEELSELDILPNFLLERLQRLKLCEEFLEYYALESEFREWCNRSA